MKKQWDRLMDNRNDTDDIVVLYTNEAGIELHTEFSSGFYAWEQEEDYESSEYSFDVKYSDLIEDEYDGAIRVSEFAFIDNIKEMEEV